MTEKRKTPAERRAPSGATRRGAPDRISDDDKTRAPGDWQGEILARVRSLIARASPEIFETEKWHKPSNSMRGVPVWERDGIICTGETYKDKVKLTFANGAALPDPARLFNASLDGGTRRAIDMFEGDALDGDAFMALVRAAAAFNAEKASGGAISARAKPKRK